MLTISSGINLLTGYQVQLDASQTSKLTSTPDRPSGAGNQNDDPVNISQKAKEIHQVYQGKKSRLEQNYNKEAQALEREYLQEKNRLQREFSQKKKSLEIDIVA